MTENKKEENKKRKKKSFFADSEKKLENPLKIVFSTRITRKWIFQSAVFHLTDAVFVDICFGFVVLVVLLWYFN